MRPHMSRVKCGRVGCWDDWKELKVTQRVCERERKNSKRKMIVPEQGFRETGFNEKKKLLHGCFLCYLIGELLD